jgi:hypothetical protein
MNKNIMRYCEIRGQYYIKCAYELCQKLFWGRINKYYCCDNCRERQKSLKRGMVAEAAKGDNLKVIKAIRIILDNFKPNFRGRSKISEVDLVRLGFPFDVPAVKIKTDHHDNEIDSIGEFCFYKKGDYFYFQKLKTL